MYYVNEVARHKPSQEAVLTWKNKYWNYIKLMFIFTFYPFFSKFERYRLYIFIYIERFIIFYPILQIVLLLLLTDTIGLNNLNNFVFFLVVINQ